MIWIALVIGEVKFRELWFFKYVFWGSLISLFFAFPGAGLLAFKEQPRAKIVAAAVSFLMTPVFIMVGVMLVAYFKIAIGGHPS